MTKAYTSIFPRNAFHKSPLNFNAVLVLTVREESYSRGYACPSVGIYCIQPKLQVVEQNQLDIRVQRA